MQVNIIDSFYQNFRVVDALGADKPSLAHFSGQVNSEHWAKESGYGTFILFIPICTAKEKILQSFMVIPTPGTELSHLDHFCLG